MKVIRVMHQTQLITVTMLHIQSIVTDFYNAHGVLWSDGIAHLDYSGIPKKDFKEPVTGQLTLNAKVKQLSAQRLKLQHPKELQ